MPLDTGQLGSESTNSYHPIEERKLKLTEEMICAGSHSQFVPPLEFETVSTGCWPDFKCSLPVHLILEIHPPLPPCDYCVMICLASVSPTRCRVLHQDT